MLTSSNNIILGGDPFCDVFRGLYDTRNFWNLTDPDYCVSVMQAAYEGGCRCFEISFPAVQEMFVKLRAKTTEPLTGLANPTYLQGAELHGKPLQFLRSRVLATFAEREGFLTAQQAHKLKTSLRHNACMVFGYNPQAQPLTDEEIAQITLNETSYKHRLAGLDACDEVLVGGTDADWLFTLGREDIIASMCEIVRSLGKRPHLICHYASAVLPKADAIGLNVGKYFAPINKEWAWLDKEEAIEAVRHAQKPVIAFMAFACGHLGAKWKTPPPGSATPAKSAA